MTDFSEAVIYGIYCKDKNILENYIGSTHDKKEREQGHKDNCNNENSDGYNYKVYNFIRDNGGWDNWVFIVIERFPCENETQLRIQEQYHYDLLNPELNMRRPYISEKDRKEYQEKYYQDNIEERKEYNAKYNENNRDEILKRKAKHYQDNSDEIIEKSKKRYKDNRDEILKKLKQKITCECGKEYNHGKKKIHYASKKHIEIIEKQK
jgi:hypothetical protein